MNYQPKDWSRGLSKLELFKINIRIKEIAKVIDSTDDDDILNNLDAELDYLMGILERSMKIARIRESGLKIVS